MNVCDEKFILNSEIFEVGFRSCRKYFKLKIKIFVNYEINMTDLLNLFFIFIRNCVDCRLFADVKFI